MENELPKGKDKRIMKSLLTVSLAGIGLASFFLIFKKMPTFTRFMKDSFEKHGKEYGPYQKLLEKLPNRRNNNQPFSE